MYKHTVKRKNQHLQHILKERKNTCERQEHHKTMILQLLNQYVYKLEYIILGTIKDTPIKISIDDTFYDIRQKINNPDLVKIHKEDLKKYGLKTVTVVLQ